MRTPLPLVLALALVWASPARAELTAEDRLQALYSPMFAFSADNVPIVRVGLVSGASEVRLETHGAVRVSAADAGGLEWWLDRPASLRVVSRSGTPAVVRHTVVVETLHAGDFEALRARTEAWQKLGYPVKAVEKGRVFGYFGKMFDNRRVELVVDRTFETREQARKLVTEIATTTPGEYGVRTVLEHLPSGEMEVFIEGVPGSLRSTSVFSLEPRDGTGITVKGVQYGKGFAWDKREDVAFDGEIYVTFGRDGKLVAANTVDAETLLKGVVAGEIFANAPTEALKTQAVTARGEILSKIGLRHEADPFHICADVDCQVYKGRSGRNAAIDGAVDATRGEMIFARGALVQAYYHSDSGGFTEANENAWTDQDPDPALRCTPDLPTVPAGFEDGVPPDRVAEWLDHAPRTWSSELPQAKNTFRWTRTVARRDVEAALPAALKSPAGARLEKLEVTKRGCSGRVIAMTLTVGGKDYPVEGELTLRKLLGGKDALRSSLFLVDLAGDTLAFRGGGFGHGVGMSQMGAIGRAKAGHGYKQILGAYYLGSDVQKIY
jgi:SpoIID/LytB domain protein